MNIRLISDLKNKFIEIEKALDEADFEAKNSIKRLTRQEVFSKIRSKTKASSN